MTPRHISVCICTYKRADFLQRLLEKLEQQSTGDAFSFSIVVADNDATRSAEGLVARFAQRSSVKIVYGCEPRKNIAMVRNLTIALAKGDFIAFIDDDEFPAEGWLSNLLKTCDAYDASGVLGPVRPHFEDKPASWIVKGGFCERPEYPTGTVMDWRKTRTGNVLFRRAILEEGVDPFNPEFGTGGEDVDFFQRMIRKGGIFYWCNEAVVYETVPPDRQTRGYMLRRALLRGRNSLKHRPGRALLLLKSAIAIPIYLIVLFITLFLGQHIFMKYCIKFCDHLGRMLALLGLNPVSER